MSDFDDMKKALSDAVKAIKGDPGPWLDTATSEQLDRIAADMGIHRQFSVEGKVICKHEWVEYTGLRESYSYCKKCDEKAISDKKL